MQEYNRIILSKFLKSVGEDEIKTILSTFICPPNRDIEQFLKQKPIEFAKQGLSSTHLVLIPHKDKDTLAGYFTLANKQIEISKTDMQSFGDLQSNHFVQCGAD